MSWKKMSVLGLMVMGLVYLSEWLMGLDWMGIGPKVFVIHYWIWHSLHHRVVMKRTRLGVPTTEKHWLNEPELVTAEPVTAGPVTDCKMELVMAEGEEQSTEATRNEL